MKKLLVCLFGLASIHAVASSGLRYEWPSVNGIAVNNACVAGDHFRSLTPVQRCTATEVVAVKACRYANDSNEICRPIKKGERIASGERIDTATRCTAWSNSIVTVARTQTVDVCTKYNQPQNDSQNFECLKIEKQLKTAPTVYYVRMFRETNEGESFAGQIKYTIPNCR